MSLNIFKDNKESLIDLKNDSVETLCKIKGQPHLVKGLFFPVLPGWLKVE
jgi:hypothetical protein